MGAAVVGDERQAISRARRIEASYFDATRGMADSEALRLSSLHSGLSAFLAEHPRLGPLADLVLVPGEPPKLWIDLVTSVVMEPHFRSYRIQQEFPDKLMVLLETTRQDEALRFLEAYLKERSRQPVRRRDSAQPEPAEITLDQGSSLATIIYAWLAGLVLGLLIVLAIVNLLK